MIDAALEDEMSGNQVSPAELREIFGDGFDDDYATEAEQRWGDTDAWQQSSRRTQGYSVEQWQQVKDEQDDLNARFVAAMRAGHAAGSEAGTALAEEARQQICRWFYDCPREMHAAIAQMYVTDPRFTASYEEIAPGLAQYVHDAVVANGARG
ncbi:TipAS antibiotic-recognition domain-containing protein [uncultured Serinicoccus sp.]|uniref:TipAS antibiotic-recognition domain-containing protein n=1 Tax=uncultured Serinicoccus sp. TaxID=735514 RepID=UPI0034577103